MAGINKPECECIFCGRSIADAGFDPCQLVLITNWLEPEEHQLKQQFLCHAECFRRLIRPGLPKVPLAFETLEPRWWEKK